MKITISLLFLVLFANYAAGQKTIDELLLHYNTRSIPYLSVDELRMYQMNDTVVILDTREPEEFNVSHLNSAINVGYNEFSSEDEKLQKINKNAQIIVYCSVGIRSETIGDKLKKAGFKNVKNLYGGIFEWKNKGYPVIDTTGIETEKVHAFSKHWSKYLQAGKPIY